jgi:hypothetical protein
VDFPAIGASHSQDRCFIHPATSGAPLSFTEFLISAFEAWDLLAGQLLPWLVVVAVFLVVVESLMFIPYIGFVV